MPTTLAQSDALSLSDALTVRLGVPMSRAGEDNLFLSDSLQLILLPLVPNLSDQFSLSDGLQIQGRLGLALSDSLSISDALTPPIEVIEVRLQLSDSLSLSDTSSISSSVDLDQYLRRYLNDVG